VPARPVVFLCYGNICRSPMAAAFFRRLVAEAGLAEHYRIDSAGLLRTGDPVHPSTAAILLRRGLPGADGLSRALSPAESRAQPLVLAMEERLAERARTMGFRQAYNLAPFASLGRDRTDIADPMGLPPAAFEAAAARLDALLPGLLARLELERRELARKAGPGPQGSTAGTPDREA